MAYKGKTVITQTLELRKKKAQIFLIEFVIDLIPNFN